MQEYQTFISLSYRNDYHLRLTDAERVVGAECEAVRTGALDAAHQVAAGAGRPTEAGSLAALVHVAARAAVGGQRDLGIALPQHAKIEVEANASGDREIVADAQIGSRARERGLPTP